MAKHLGATVATTTSEANRDWVKRLGAAVVVDYRNEDFEAILHDYDVVLDTQGGKTLDKSFRVLKPGGAIISVSGPPDPDFARDFDLHRILRPAIRLLSYRIRRRARRRASGIRSSSSRRAAITSRRSLSLVDAGDIRPVVDRVFPFDATKEALAYVETGRAKGKVVVKVR